MLNASDWVIIALYLGLVVLIGLLYSKKSSRSLEDFFAGGRAMPWWLAGLSMVATTFAADTPLAVTEIVRQNGISGNWLWWNFLIGGMLTTFFFAKLWRRSEVLTELELIKIRYSGKEAVFLRGFKAVYLGLLMNVVIIGWVNLAMISILQVFFNLDFSQAYLIVLALMFLAFVYSVLSGIWGVAVTDAIQFFIALAGTIILAVLVINSDKIGGIAGLKSKIDYNALNFFPEITAKNAHEVLGLSFGAFLVYGLFQWWASWYPGAEPGGGGYIAQRMLSTKNETHSFLATMFFQFFHYIVRPFPWILVGLATIVLYPDLQSDTYRLGYVYAMRDFLPNGLKGLLLVAFFAAYMSTISTQLNFASSILTNDFYLLFAKNKAERQKVFIARIFTLVVMIIAAVTTLYLDSISGAWKFIIECGAGLGFVLIARWYWWRINAWSEITAMIVPFVTYALIKLTTQISFPQSYFITVGLTIVLTIAITYITKPTDFEKLKMFYAKVKPQGWWQPFSKQKGVNLNLIGAWLSSVIFLYSLLFVIGKFLLQFYFQAFVALIIALISGILLFLFLREAKI